MSALGKGKRGGGRTSTHTPTKKGTGTAAKRSRRARRNLRTGKGVRGGVANTSAVEYGYDSMALTLMRFFDQYPEFVHRIESLVDADTGRPRLIAVRTMLILMFIAGSSGKLLLVDVRKVAVNLHRGIQTLLGIASTDVVRVPRTEATAVTYRRQSRSRGLHHRASNDEPPSGVTDRQIQYLFHKIADALTESIPEGTFIDEATGHVVDVYTGEIVKWRPNIPLDAFGNDLLAALWDFLEIPRPTEGAIDSFPIASHFGSKSMGGTKFVDFKALEVLCPRTKFVSGDSAKLRAFWAEWNSARGDEPLSPGQPNGPAVPLVGDGSRSTDEFPWTDSTGRLHHNLDLGAADTYRGAGNNRDTSIVHGRDLHLLVATGTLPNGDVYPALPIAFTPRMGASSQAHAGRDLVFGSVARGFPLCLVRGDRAYTKGSNSRFKAPLAEANITVIGDLEASQRGLNVREHGVLELDGFFFTSGLPHHLRSLPGFHPNMTRDERDSLAAEYDQRVPFAARSMGTDSKGRTRFRMPSAGKVTKTRGGYPKKFTGYTARCINSPYFNLMTDMTKPQTACAPGEPCCCSMTISVTPATLPEAWEPTLYGTTNWLKAKGPRSSVESANSWHEYHKGVDSHGIRVHPRHWELANLAREVALFLQRVYSWFIELGLQPNPARQRDYLHPTEIAAVVSFINTPPPDLGAKGVNGPPSP